jgi:hypothetical protein
MKTTLIAINGLNSVSASGVEGKEGNPAGGDQSFLRVERRQAGFEMAGRSFRSRLWKWSNLDIRIRNLDGDVTGCPTCRLP